ncbi:conserved hypothetical protein [Staphylococcus capitis C87]|nr:conserved hypothetical protein [Staphylococcus capitis C87]
MSIHRLLYFPILLSKIQVEFLETLSTLVLSVSYAVALATVILLTKMHFSAYIVSLSFLMISDNYTMACPL